MPNLAAINVIHKEKKQKKQKKKKEKKRTDLLAADPLRMRGKELRENQPLIVKQANPTTQNLPARRLIRKKKRRWNRRRRKRRGWTFMPRTHSRYAARNSARTSPP